MKDNRKNRKRIIIRMKRVLSRFKQEKKTKNPDQRLFSLCVIEITRTHKAYMGNLTKLQKGMKNRLFVDQGKVILYFTRSERLIILK